MLTLKVTRIGADDAVVLDGEVEALSGVREGDLLQLTRTPEGSLRLVPHRRACAGRAKSNRCADVWRELTRVAGGLGRMNL
ncbi:MAG TPA: hypothetical protein VGE60_12970 [Telluria sp.]